MNSGEIFKCFAFGFVILKANATPALVNETQSEVLYGLSVMNITSMDRSNAALKNKIKHDLI